MLLRSSTNHLVLPNEQAVEQSSAVIDGRLSDGLTVDHSGLNKYTSEQDPNFIKVAGVVAGMIESSRSKSAQAKKLSQGIGINIPGHDMI